MQGINVLFTQADVWLLVTCSIREGAESKVYKKLANIRKNKKKGGLRYSACPNA